MHRFDKFNKYNAIYKYVTRVQTSVTSLSIANAHKGSNIRRTKSPNLDVSHLGLQLSLRNIEAKC